MIRLVGPTLAVVQNRTRRHWMSLHEKAVRNSHTGLLEKAEIKWFTFAELRKNRGKFRAFYRNMVDVILEHEAEITSKLKKPVCGPKCSFRVARSTGPGRSKHRNLTVKKRQTRRTRRRN